MSQNFYHFFPQMLHGSLKKEKGKRNQTALLLVQCLTTLPKEHTTSVVVSLFAWSGKHCVGEMKSPYSFYIMTSVKLHPNYLFTKLQLTKLIILHTLAWDFGLKLWWYYCQELEEGGARPSIGLQVLTSFGAWDTHVTLFSGLFTQCLLLWSFIESVDEKLSWMEVLNAATESQTETQEKFDKRRKSVRQRLNRRVSLRIGFPTCALFKLSLRVHAIRLLQPKGQHT